VGSPRRSATRAWENSWIVMAITRPRIQKTNDSGSENRVESI